MNKRHQKLLYNMQELLKLTEDDQLDSPTGEGAYSTDLTTELGP